MSGGGAYYNDTDPFCCEWLQRLMDAGEITPGTIDNRSITDVKPDDLAGHERVHFFAGIGGWELALRLAGWSGPVWTGSCPCQPYSAAGKRQGDADPRNLWPAFFRLIRECSPPVVFGEQVSSAIRHGWLDGICGDLEAEGYAVGAAVLGAHSVGAPHIRQRLYWLANADLSYCRSESEAACDEQQEANGPANKHGGCGRSLGRLGNGIGTRLEGRAGQRRDDGTEQQAIERAGDDADRLADAADSRCKGAEDRRASRKNATGGTRCSESERDSDVDRLGNTSALRRQGRDGTSQQEQGTWSRCALVLCRDGKTRRISAQPGDEPLAHGIPRSMGPELAGLRGMATAARRNRVGRLKGYGNAIVPQVAAEFIRAYMEAGE